MIPSATEDEHDATHDRSRRALAGPAVDVAIAVAWFVVAGAVGALVWWQVVSLPKVTKTGQAATFTAEGLVMQVGIDGWFFVVATVLGLVSGVALMAWRPRRPVLLVVLMALGGGLAAWLMLRLGLWLGPGDEIDALRGLSDGSQVSMQLKLHAGGIAWMWPIAATIGALSHLWIVQKPDTEQPAS